jgi:hypothetical protein
LIYSSKCSDLQKLKPETPYKMPTIFNTPPIGKTIDGQYTGNTYYDHNLPFDLYNDAPIANTRTIGIGPRNGILAIDMIVATTAIKQPTP